MKYDTWYWTVGICMEIVQHMALFVLINEDIQGLKPKDNDMSERQTDRSLFYVTPYDPLSKMRDLCGKIWARMSIFTARLWTYILLNFVKIDKSLFPTLTSGQGKTKPPESILLSKDLTGKSWLNIFGFCCANLEVYAANIVISPQAGVTFPIMKSDPFWHVQSHK